MRVLSGDCVDLGESELAYAPLVAALRPLVRDCDPALDALPAPLRAELASILPTLGSGRDDDGGPDVSVQGRLFEALLELLDRLGEETPVLLVIEDLHWADRSTRGFLTFLARTLCSERIAVVATYRSDELHRRHPLRPLLAELERDPATRRLAAGAVHARGAEPSSWRSCSARRPTPPWSSGSASAARATRSSPRRSSPPASTAAARCRRRCATR